MYLYVLDILYNTYLYKYKSILIDMTQKLLWPKGSINEASPSDRNPVLAAHRTTQQAWSEPRQLLGPGIWLAGWFLRTEGLNDHFTTYKTHITQEEGKLIGKSPQVSFPLESGFLSRSWVPPLSKQTVSRMNKCGARREGGEELARDEAPGRVQEQIEQSCGEGCGVIWWAPADPWKF